MKCDIAKLISKYFYLKPDKNSELEKVKFGTSGHRGTPLKKSFNEEHILAITEAICEYKKQNGINGPVFVGKDTHALSTPAQMSAIRVLSKHNIITYISKGYTPTPVISFTVLEHNKTHKEKADGIVITPSHNPPEDGGFKYNPPNGGAAGTDVTNTIQKSANRHLLNTKAPDFEEALKHIKQKDFITPYVKHLNEIINIEAVKKSNMKIAADPLGGSSVEVYQKINEIYGLNIDINTQTDYTFSFMPKDYDGKIRMDCSSPYAMANLLKLKNDYDIAFGNDTDSDRHGIVTPKGGLLNPNHYLSVMIYYLFKHRNWPKHLKVGKTVVSSSMIDRVANSLGVEIYETPVGFKWFAQGLFDKTLGFAGEESAGASFLRFNADVWSTDKDGIIAALLAAEIKAVTKKDPYDIYLTLEEKFGKSYYQRIDAPANCEQKKLLKNLSPEDVTHSALAGEKIEKILTKAPGNNEPIGGIKIITKNGWAAMRPSGTEDVYKIYAESFISQEHLKNIQKEAKEIINKLFKDIK